MLGNNNRAIVDKLAKNSVKTNRKQYGILFLTIILASFMLFCVLTIGTTYLKSGRLQNTRLSGAEYDIAIINGFTREQLATLRENSDVESVGIESYAGYISGTEFDETAEVGLLWCDDVFWEKQMAPVRAKLDGRYPENKNEIAVMEGTLKALGNEDLSVGDSLTLTYENNTGVYTEEFVISGIWNGYGDETAAFVSEAFYDEAGYNLTADGILCIKLKSDYVLPGTIDGIEESLNLSERQIFAPSAYIENSFRLLLGICGLALVICLSAYLLIYNILYLSVTGKIRYYGLLQSLGMTKKQLVRFIVKQMAGIVIFGMAIGILAGLIVCMKLIPYVMGVLGISDGNISVSFSPMILLISIVVTGASILLGMRRPVKTATDVTPTEAVKYRESISASKGYRKKKGAFFWRMAMKQLRKDRKKTVIVLLSLATSLSVFYCLTTIISSQGGRTVLPNYMDADLIVRNHTQTTGDINSLKPAIDDSFIEELEAMEGVRDIHVVEGVPVTFPYVQGGFSDMWMKNYIERTPYLSYDEVMEDYASNPSAYYGMIKGVDEAEFDYINESMAEPVDKQDFLSGKVCIVRYDGSEIPEESLGGKISFEFQGRQYEITPEAVSYEAYYSSRNIGPTMIVSQDYLKSLTANPEVLSVSVYYEESYDTTLEEEITSLLEESLYSRDLHVESLYENMKAIEEASGNMMEIGAVISLLLLLVGALNYINTISGGIQNRKLTFSIMEGIGMSRKQIKRLLIREGVLYAVFSVLITLTAGSVITYICFQSMNYMEIPFSVPISPIIAAIMLVTMICTLAPLLSYRKLAGRRSIVERLRDYE